MYSILDCSSGDMLNFDFLWKGLRLAFPPHFVYDFSRKMFFVLYSIHWPNLTVWLPLLLEILANMCIVIICCPVYDAINFEVSLDCLIKPYSNMIKQDVKLKALFIIFNDIPLKYKKSTVFRRWALTLVPLPKL